MIGFDPGFYLIRIEDTPGLSAFAKFIGREAFLDQSFDHTAMDPPKNAIISSTERKPDYLVFLVGMAPLYLARVVRCNTEREEP